MRSFIDLLVRRITLKKFKVVWDEIFSVSSHQANLEMINFWAPCSPGKGPPKGHNFRPTIDSAIVADSTEPPDFA